MYPTPSRYHRPTNYYWVLLLLVAAMLVGLLLGLRLMARHFNPATSSPSSSASQSSAATSSPLAAAAAQPSVAPTATATATNSAVVQVDPQQLAAAPATYQGHTVRVRGTVFYTGKLGNGQTWLQIVGPGNVYVDGQMSAPLPAGVVKGAQVEVTGIGAGLTNITAANGKNYDQAFINPIQKVAVASAQPSA